MGQGEFNDQVRRLSSADLTRFLAFVLLLSAAALAESGALSALRDDQIWEHLRIGSWILQHRSLPRFGIFSQSESAPWRDCNWGYDILVALFYGIAGLRALPLLLMMVRLTLATVTFLLAGGWRNFWGSVVLSGLAQYLLLSTGSTVTAISLLLFGVELLLLVRLRSSGDSHTLFLLPPLFLLWANFDTGFVYGVGLYFLFLAALLIERWNWVVKHHWVDTPNNKISLQNAALVGGACVIASLVTPYGFYSYNAFWADRLSPVNRYLQEYAAMGFREPQDYLLLWLAMGAFLSLGILQSRDVFPISVLVGCTALSFFARKDLWLVTLVAVAILGQSILHERNAPTMEKETLNRGYLIPVGLAMGLVLLSFAVRVPRNHDVLLARVAEKFPVRAADFIKAQKMEPPLFNTYRWGSFLMWYLPEYRVAIDGRRDLYSQEEQLNYFKVMQIEVPYKTFPTMNHARTLLLDKADVMTDAFREVPGFRVAYEDNIAIVYVHTLAE